MRFISRVIASLLLIMFAGCLFKNDSIIVSDFGNVWQGENVIEAEVISKEQAIEETRARVQDEKLKIVKVALEQVGNIGGEKFWSWYGLRERVPWCCIFISWCADQCGYLEDGIIPRFAAVSQGYRFYTSRDQYLGPDEIPEPGMIVFFNYPYVDEGGNYISPNHVGIVKCVKDGRVYCIEGNYKDGCFETNYEIGHRLIYGYGAPAYDQK